jgi:hypothetical protein
MKNMLKIMGIVLTLAMLSGLLMAVAPVSTSAATLSWSDYTMPKVTAGTDANCFAFSGDGKTMFAFVSPGASILNATTGINIYKSTDSGMTWSNSSLDSGAVISLNTLDSHVKRYMLAVNPNNINDVIFSDGKDIYRSTNSGQNFFMSDPNGYTYSASNNWISGIDIANSSNGQATILVGWSGSATGTPAYNGGVALLDTSIGIWRTTAGTTSSTQLGATWAAANALAVAFSPNYANDAGIIAISCNATLVGSYSTGTVSVRTQIVATGSEWGGLVRDGILKMSNAPIPPSGSLFANIALPSDFVPSSASQNRVFIGLGDTNTTTTSAGIDVYRMNGTTASGAFSTVYNLGAGINVSSVAYAGNSTTGQLAAGQYNSNTIYSTNSVTNNSPSWTSSANSPSGTSGTLNTLVKFLPGSTATAYTLYAGTAGAYSELATSTDLNSFWGVGLIRMSFGAARGNSSGTGTQQIYQVMRSGAPNAPTDVSLFYSADGGNTWKKIYDNAGISFSIYKSPAFATDKTIYLMQSDWTISQGTLTPPYGPATVATNGIKSNQIVKTSDAGLTWTTLNTPGNVSAKWIAAIDANSYWVASPDRGIQNSSSSVYASIEGKVPNQIFVFPGMFVCTTKSGEVYLSTDSGVTFNRLGNVNQFITGGGQWGAESSSSGNGFPPITFDVPNKTIYVVDLGSHNIMKWTVGTDASWQVYLNSSSLPATLQGTAQLLYRFNTGTTSAPVWVVSPTVSASNHPISFFGLGTDGNWYIESNNNFDVSSGTVVQNNQIWYTSDLLNITFAPLSQTRIQDMGGSIGFPYSPGQTKDASGNTLFLTGITQGTVDSTTGNIIATTASATSPASPNGYVSQVLQFTNTLSAGVKLTSPDGKSPTGTSTTTSNGTFDQVNFSWTAVSYTNPKYHFQVAYDKLFTNIATTANSANLNTYNSAGTSSQTTSIDLNYLQSNGASAVPLSPGQTYYWRVRVESPVISKWSDPIMFTTVVTSSTSGGIDQTGRISPVNGQTSVSVTPAITWGSVPGATGYDFKIATDPAFTNVVDSFTNKSTTVYSPAKALDPNKTYYWEVRALNGTAAGDWVISAFTTQTVAVPTGAPSTGAPSTGTAPVAPITVVVPTQPPANIVVTVPPNTVPAPAPATPGYIWVIIAIGAVLVIAVIVLIARTRRV